MNSKSYRSTAVSDGGFRSIHQGLYHERETGGVAVNGNKSKRKEGVCSLVINCDERWNSTISSLSWRPDVTAKTSLLLHPVFVPATRTLTTLISTGWQWLGLGICSINSLECQPPNPSPAPADPPCAAQINNIAFASCDSCLPSRLLQCSKPARCISLT